MGDAAGGGIEADYGVLVVVQLGVEPTPVEQGGVAAALGGDAVFDDQDVVRERPEP